MAVWRDSLIIMMIAALLLLGEATWSAPMPPGWAERSTKIALNGVAVSSCPIDGYSWTVEKGPDFDVFRFTNAHPSRPAAGFYVGFHPNSPAASATRSLKGMVSNQPVEWFVHDGEHEGLRFDSVFPVQVPGEDMRGLSIHFWMVELNESDADVWLKWAECIKVKFG